ncbi:unnamed protein product [Candida verbasci]|uniref:GP-PDE domain-containing protein n=1 Tax=Candida verbasci TaxID=1227364 RepID=A0A9W4U0B1_9ASCO|nr:unnamed protein product [Candida verbasci]
MSSNLSSPTSSTTTSPVIVGHRGFKSKYEENTLFGFKKCFETGAKVIETDLWLSKDNVIVISHDQSTKRIFVDAQGQETNYKIPETDYNPILKSLRTKERNEPLLTFKDVLNWFISYIETQPDSNEYKLQLDIKRFNQPKILKFVIEDLLSVNDSLSFWFHRIQFGLWDLNFLKYLNQNEYFQKVFEGCKVNDFGYSQFDIFHISVNWRDSIHYINYNFYLDENHNERIKIKLTGISLIYLSTWSIGFITKFIPLLRIQNLKLYSWTINNKIQFNYLNEVGRLSNLIEYGIITDYPDVMSRIKTIEEELNIEMGKEMLVRSESKDYYNEDGLLSINLSLKQKLLYFIYKYFNYFAGQKRVLDDETKFDAKVDENEIRYIHINPFFMWVFQTCQKYGLL